MLIEDYHIMETRAERAEDEVADLKHQLSLAQAVYADRIPYSLHLKSDVDEIEKLRVQLVACSVASLQNTEEGVKLRLNSTDPHWSVAYADVCAAVDREMTVRKEVDQLRAKLIYTKSNLEQYKNAYKLKVEQHNFDKNSWKLELIAKNKRTEALETILQGMPNG
jgi:hypothetical protein